MKYHLKKYTEKEILYSCEELTQIRNKIISRMKYYYSKFPNINSILLVGSRQGQAIDQYSDLDFFIFYEQDAPSIGLRKQFIKSIQNKDDHIFVLDDHSYEYGISDDFEVESIEVCQTFYQCNATEKQIDAVFSGFYRKIGFYYPMAIIAAIAEGDILYSNNEFIAKLKQKCTRYPKNLKNLVIREELPMLNYYISRMHLAIFRKDLLYFHDLVYQAMDSILQVVFALNSTYLYALVKELNLVVSSSKTILSNYSEISKNSIHPCAEYFLYNNEQ